MIIFEGTYGSYLYGTNGENSDKDFKGVYLPDLKELLLNNYNKSFSEKNIEGNIEKEYYSLHYFIQLACKGETVALDMLHIPDQLIIKKHPIWDDIIKHKNRFYSKNCRAFIGYCKNQAIKYSIKGTKLESLNKLKDFLNSIKFDKNDSYRIGVSDIWDNLPLDENLKYYTTNNLQNKNILEYSICGKIIQSTTSIDYVLNVVNNLLGKFSERSIKTSENNNTDWKALSHAFRVIFELREILTENKITFPLNESKFISDIKFGRYTDDDIFLKLEEYIIEIEELFNNSNLPEQPDIDWWNNFLFYKLKEFYLI